MLAVLAVAVLIVAVVAACRARDDVAADSAAKDTAPTDGSSVDSAAVATEGTSPSTSALGSDASRESKPKVRPGEDARADLLPSPDSTRLTRPEMPQVSPGKRPRTWRGFKLPEEQPVRTPLETLRLREQAPDSVMKGDSTKPPQPDR